MLKRMYVKLLSDGRYVLREVFEGRIAESIISKRKVDGFWVDIDSNGLWCRVYDRFDNELAKQTHARWMAANSKYQIEQDNLKRTGQAWGC